MCHCVEVRRLFEVNAAEDPSRVLGGRRLQLSKPYQNGSLSGCILNTRKVLKDLFCCDLDDCMTHDVVSPPLLEFLEAWRLLKSLDFHC